MFSLLKRSSYFFRPTSHRNNLINSVFSSHISQFSTNNANSSQNQSEEKNDKESRKFGIIKRFFLPFDFAIDRLKNKITRDRNSKYFEETFREVIKKLDEFEAKIGWDLYLMLNKPTIDTQVPAAIRENTVVLYPENSGSSATSTTTYKVFFVKQGKWVTDKVNAQLIQTITMTVLALEEQEGILKKTVANIKIIQDATLKAGLTPKISDIRPEFIKEFGKNLSVPYAYQKDSSEIIDMEYEKSVAKAIGESKVQFIVQFIFVLLIGGCVKWLLEEREEDAKNINTIQNHSNPIFGQADKLINDLYDIFYTEQTELDESQLSNLFDFPKKIQYIIGDIERLIDEANKNGLNLSALVFSRDLIEEKKLLLKKLQQLKDAELPILRILVKSIVQNSVNNYESALKNLEQIVSNHIKNENWEKCLEKIIENENMDQGKHVDADIYLKEKYRNQDVDKKLVAFVWFMISTIYMKKTNECKDVLVKYPKNNDEFQRSLEDWKQTALVNDLLFIFSPTVKLWKAYLVEDNKKTEEITINIDSRFSMELNRITQSNSSFYDKREIRLLLGKEKLFQSYPVLKERNQALISSICCAINSWRIYNTPFALENAGLSCSLMRNHELAKKIQIKTIEMYPTFVFGYIDYADTLWRTNDFVIALEEIEKALILESNNTVIKGKKAEILQSKAVEPNLTSEERIRHHQEIVRLLESSENLERMETLSTKQQKDKYSPVLCFSKEYLRKNDYKNEKNSFNDIEKNKDFDATKHYCMIQ